MTGEGGARRPPRRAGAPAPAAAPAEAASARAKPPPRELDDTSLQHLVGYAASRAAIELRKVFTAHMAPFDLRVAEFTILMLVASNPHVTQRQMSLALEVSAPRLTLVCDKLEERELITRTRSDHDRRKQYIALSRKGTALVRKAERIADHMEKELLGHLTELEQTMLFQLLEKVAIHRRV